MTRLPISARALAALPLVCVPLAVPPLAVLPSAAAAQPAEPGAHFLLNWDLDGDGAVTLDEARQKRGDLFYMFDQNEDGVLGAEEYDLFDETRAADMAANTAGGPAMRRVSAGMGRQLNDADGDGEVSEAEFVAGADAWFARMDRNGDGVMTTADFGPGDAQAPVRGPRREGGPAQGAGAAQGAGKGQGPGQGQR